MKVTYTVREVADELSVSVETVRAWIRAGRLPAKHIGKGDTRLSYRIRHADLEAFLDSLPDG